MALSFDSSGLDSLSVTVKAQQTVSFSYSPDSGWQGSTGLTKEIYKVGIATVDAAIEIGTGDSGLAVGLDFTVDPPLLPPLTLQTCRFSAYQF